jgi:hypothetical protein
MLSARVRFFLVAVGGVAPSGASTGRKEGDGGVSAACAVTMTLLGVVVVVDIAVVENGAGVFSGPEKFYSEIRLLVSTNVAGIETQKKMCGLISLNTP